MRKKWTRRTFLGASVASAIVRGGGGTKGLAAGPGGSRAQERSPAPVFDSRQRELLRAAIDEVIPAGEGMPSASEAGGVEYLERGARSEAEIREPLRNSLARLDALARTRFNQPFTQLARADRVAALQALEMEAPGLFEPLRDCVYESYYTQPAVWKLIGYEFYPTNGAGPRMKPFDEAALAQVRKRPKFYREAP